MESKSSSNSLDTYSLKFCSCRNIYPIRLIKPCERYKYDGQNQLRLVLDDLNSNDMVIDCAVGDNPKRSFFWCAKCHSVSYGCEYCVNCAISFENPVAKKKKDLVIKKIERQKLNLLNEIEEREEDSDADLDATEFLRRQLILVEEQLKEQKKIKNKKKLTWPFSTMKGNARTINSITEISNEIETNPNVLKTNQDYCKGIKGTSHFLTQPYFNMLKDLPCEYMHIVCLGVVKRMVVLTFKVGENRDRITNRKLSDPKTFDILIVLIQVPREFGRRYRSLDFGVMKASELRNIILFFPISLGLH